MPNIYEFTQSFSTLWMLLEDEAVEDSVIEDAFANLTDDLKAKLENCCKYIKNEEASIKGLKEEEARLKAKRTAAENRISRLKVLMQNVMMTAGEKKLPCGTFTVSIQKNPESVVVDEHDITKIPKEYLKFAEPEVDKAKIKEALKDGAEFSFAHLTQTEGVRIR